MSSSSDLTATAELGDVPAIRALLAETYFEDPLTQWIFPERSTRAHAVAGWYGLFVEQYVTAAQATVVRSSGEVGAVALWRGPSDPPLSPGGVPSIAGLLDALVGAERGAEIADGLHAVAAVMPSEPHVYLNFLAVAPSRQERGLGRLAIAPVLSAARSAGLFVYLGTTNPANHGFFERLGFVESRSVAIGDGPRLRAMRWDG